MFNEEPSNLPSIDLIPVMINIVELDWTKSQTGLRRGWFNLYSFFCILFLNIQWFIFQFIHSWTRSTIIWSLISLNSNPIFKQQWYVYTFNFHTIIQYLILYLSLPSHHTSNICQKRKIIPLTYHIYHITPSIYFSLKI